MKKHLFNLSSLPGNASARPAFRTCAHFRSRVRRTVSLAALLLAATLMARAETWNLEGGGSWTNAGNWNPANVPNAVGASATFNNAASGDNPAQANNTTINLDGTKTVGSITFNNNAANTFTYAIATGSGGPLVFDESGAGPATVTVPAAVGTGNNTISVGMSLADPLVAIVNHVTASSAAGALNLTGTISGAGGFTKEGDGLATFGTGAKTYTGPTILNGGRMRMSSAARPQQTSSFTINAGAQLTLITAASFNFGTEPLNLNGSGPVSGPFAAFPGAIRNDTGLAVGISNAIVLQSDTLLHVQGAAGSLTLSNIVSGVGKLTLTSQPHDANLGTLVLTAANTYAGGTAVDGGTVLVSGNVATLGTGNVTVNSANLSFAGSSARLVIEAGVGDAIANTAILSLAGGRTAGMADDGYISLGDGVNETVGGLVLGGVAQGPGSYGSTASAATFQDNEYFSGTGIVTVPQNSPGLAINRAAPDVVLSWPTNFEGFQLQAAGSLSEVWTNRDTMVIVFGTNNTVTEPASAGTMFFRLIQEQVLPSGGSR